MAEYHLTNQQVYGTVARKLLDLFPEPRLTLSQAKNLRYRLHGLHERLDIALNEAVERARKLEEVASG